MFDIGTFAGDEGYEVNTAGSFYVFADKVWLAAAGGPWVPLLMFADIFPLQAVNIINPTTLSVTKTLTTDPTGQPLTNAGADGATANSSITWNDAVYVDVRPALLCVVLCLAVPARPGACGDVAQIHAGPYAQHCLHLRQ